MKRIYLIYLSLFLVGATFSMMYAYLIFSLPLFGDATLHAFTTKLILENGVSNVGNFMTYPPLYSIFQSITFLIYGEIGLNSVTFVGIILLMLAVFLFLRKILRRDILAILGTIFVMASPKLIVYASKMYIEIILSGFVIFSLYCAIKYVNEKENVYNLVLFSFFIAISVAIKQQALVTLLLSAIIFLFIPLKVSKGPPQRSWLKYYGKRLMIFSLIIIIVSLPFYIVLVKNTGNFGASEDNDPDFKKINEIGRQVFGYEKDIKEINFDSKWNERLTYLFNSNYNTSISKAVSFKQISPLQPFVSFNSFSKANGLYLTEFGGGSTPSGWYVLSNILIILGIVYCVITLVHPYNSFSRKMKSVLIKNRYLIFILAFIILTYVAFIKTIDQMRYYLFLPIIYSIFFCLGVYIILNLKKEKDILKRIISILIIFIIIFSTFSVLATDSKWNTRWGRSQGYSSSKGGIQSIIEAGNWIKNNSLKTDILWSNCGNEIGYYSNRKTVGNFQSYFLEKNEIKEMIKDENIKYIILLDSLIVNDSEWNNQCLIPDSFKNKIEEIYPIGYQTIIKDIKVYNAS